MASSYITGTGDDGEGCNSCESGWTMYLASPMQGDDDDGGKGSGSDGSNVDDGYGYGYRYVVHGKKKGKEYHDDGDDNDSLASDASTGPAKDKTQPSSPDGKEALGYRKHGAADDDDKDDEKANEEEDGTRTRFSTSSRKKAGNKTEKGSEGKSSKRGHGKKGSSSRTSFFW